MSTLSVLVIAFVVFLVINVPIAVCLGLAASLAIIIPGEYSPSAIAQLLYSASDSYALIAIPFFMLAGSLMELGGLSEKLVNFCDAMVGHKLGGFGNVAIICCMIFAAISGSGPATVAALGGILIPAMVRSGYSKGYAAALMATAGSIGIIIPPSIPMIVYGVQAEASVATMFMSGIIPGIVLGIALIVLNTIVCKRNGYLPAPVKKNGKERWDAFVKSIPALLMPVIILGGIYGGIFTPTEAAGVSVIYGFLIGAIIYKRITLKSIPEIMTKAAIGSATVLVIIMGAAVFSYVIQVENVPVLVTEWVTGITTSKFLILLLINIVLLVAGCFLDASSAIIILTPLLMPLSNAVGVNVYHFGIVMVVNLAIGLITPPVGLDLYVGANIAKISLTEVIRGLKWFLVVSIGILILLTYVPQITLLLPNLLGARGV